MKIGLLSDAHGNPEGLENCISVLRSRGAEQLFFLGDAVGYLPRWSEVLELLRSHDIRCIRGNHDERVLRGPLQEDATDAYQLLPSRLASIEPHLAWMATWPETLSLELDGRTLMLVHASPEDPLNGYVYPWTDVSGIDWPRADVIAMGHTHRPLARHHEGRLLINPGSCGLPRDIGHLSSCAMLESRDASFKLYRVPFDVQRVLADPGFIHPDVRQCLLRAPERYEGQLVDLPAGHSRAEEQA
jgi:putative phosphoesterase